MTTLKTAVVAFLAKHDGHKTSSNIATPFGLAAINNIPERVLSWPKCEISRKSLSRKYTEL